MKFTDLLHCCNFVWLFEEVTLKNVTVHVWSAKIGNIIAKFVLMSRAMDTKSNFDDLQSIVDQRLLYM